VELDAQQDATRCTDTAVDKSAAGPDAIEKAEKLQQAAATTPMATSPKKYGSDWLESEPAGALPSTITKKYYVYYSNLTIYARHNILTTVALLNSRTRLITTGQSQIRTSHQRRMRRPQQGTRIV
jgi:hypothetical protein